jgi:transcriptional regulator with XRE-family HTH domain
MDTENMVGFGARIRMLRKQRGWTMLEAASRMVPAKAKSTIANWEAETRRPDLDDLQQLARIYGTSTDYLLGLTEIPYSHDPVLNVREYLTRPEIHWDGKPIDKKAKALIEQFMSVAI